MLLRRFEHLPLKFDWPETQCWCLSHGFLCSCLRSPVCILTSFDLVFEFNLLARWVWTRNTLVRALWSSYTRSSSLWFLCTCCGLWPAPDNCYALTVFELLDRRSLFEMFSIVNHAIARLHHLRIVVEPTLNPRIPDSEFCAVCKPDT